MPVTVEFRRTSATGKESVVLNTIFPIRDALGKIVRIGGYANDVTELYQTRTELHAAQDLLQTIFDNVPAELYLRRLDGSYLMANHWALDFYGLTEQDLPHLTAETFDTGDGVEVSRQAQRELLATGRPVTREYHHKARGRDVVILNTIFPLRNAKGEIDRIGGVSTDITELHHARNQLRQAQESLHQSEKLAALGQLLAGIAHELNNPLAVVLGVQPSFWKSYRAHHTIPADKAARSSQPLRADRQDLPGDGAPNWATQTGRSGQQSD